MLQNMFLDGLSYGDLSRKASDSLLLRGRSSHHIAVSLWDNSWQDKFQDG